MEQTKKLPDVTGPGMVPAVMAIEAGAAVTVTQMKSDAAVLAKVPAG
jgi:hypothetical protein